MWSGVVSRDPGVTTRILTRRPRLPGSRLVVSFSLMASPATSAARAQDDDRDVELLEEDHATGRRFFKFVKGPVFANVVLADEINRAPPKTQAALLQAMQEHAVTAAGQTHRLPEPFFVLATQNPIEQEGTYPLPEAQLDRFMLQLTVGYPSREEEERIVFETTSDRTVEVKPVLTGPQLQDLLHLVRRL